VIGSLAVLRGAAEGLHPFLETREGELVSQALRQSSGRHDRAAKLLAISPRQFRYLLDKYALR